MKLLAVDDARARMLAEIDALPAENVPLARSIGRVLAEGDLDFRGTLGVAKEAAVGFADIRLTFELDTDAPQDQLDTLLKLTERYCVVLQTLRRPPAIETRLGRA